MEQTIAAPGQKVRTYLPVSLSFDSFESLKPFFEELKERGINSVSDLEQWIRDRNELECALWEEECWRMIRMNCDTENKALAASFEQFMQHIKPHILSYGNILNAKLLASPFHKEINQGKYGIYLRGMRRQAELHREENIPLNTQLELLVKQYDAITGGMTFTVRGQELTLPKAMAFLESDERELRKEVYMKREERFSLDQPKLNQLFSEMLALRHQIAQNAGFGNYRDYKFAERERFDYTPEDCFQFHDAVQNQIMPIVEEFDKRRKELLNLEQLKPWDMWVDESGLPPLKPFENADELLEKSIAVLHAVNPRYGDMFVRMKEKGCFDLDSRKGKRQGGYSCPLFKSQINFIFMNAAGSQDDVRVITHEAGHAIHSLLTWKLGLIHSQYVPSEVSEVASMTMELFSMEHWDIFYKDEAEVKRAKYIQLERCLKSLRYIASIDKFQHWIYENPLNEPEVRNKKWLEITNQFTSRIPDYSDVDQYREFAWQYTPHIYNSPFYFIEYGFARLGSLALWRNYKLDKEKTLAAYEYALSLGYTKTLPELYEAAGIKFDFSEKYIAELAAFVKGELDALR